MRYFLVSCIPLLFLFFRQTLTVAPTTASQGVPFDNKAPEYTLQDENCEIAKQCSPCTFDQMTSIKECSTQGDILVKRCKLVNKEDPKDILPQIVYEPCTAEGFARYSIYLFFVSLFGGLYISIVLLTRYRKRLQANMYKRLSLSNSSSSSKD